MKNIEWLKETKRDYLQEEINSIGFNAVSRINNKINDIIDQLDEPEVLTSDWIKDNQLIWTSIHGAEYYVPANKLYGKLVPKQELPVIPDYVAEWMETVKELDADLLNAIIDGRYNVEVSEWLFIEDDEINTLNGEKLMRAWLDGYTVEEKKYRVILQEELDEEAREIPMFFPEHKWYVHLDEKGKIAGTPELKNVPKFTEQEIKDYDERYFAFAIPVEELEE